VSRTHVFFFFFTHRDASPCRSSSVGCSAPRSFVSALPHTLHGGLSVQWKKECYAHGGGWGGVGCAVLRVTRWMVARVCRAPEYDT
jgi:hypothetical protein